MIIRKTQYNILLYYAIFKHFNAILYNNKNSHMRKFFSQFINKWLNIAI